MIFLQKYRKGKNDNNLEILHVRKIWLFGYQCEGLLHACISSKENDDYRSIFLTTGPPCGNGSKAYACISGTISTNNDKDILDKLRDQIPHKHNCLGLISSRVIARAGDEKMYYISPLTHDQQCAYVRYMMTIVGEKK